MIALGLVALVGYHWLLRPSSVQSLLEKTVVAFTDARLRVKVHYASLFFGLHLSDLDLRTTDDLPIFQAREVRLRLFLPGVLAGHLGVRELSLVEPRLTIQQRPDGTWNTDALTGPAAPEATEPDPDQTAAPLTHIDFYTPLKLFAYLSVERLSLLVQGNDMRFELNDLDLQAGLITRTRSSMPLGLELLDDIESLAVVLGGERATRLSYTAPDGRITGPVDLHLRLHRDTEVSQSHLASKLRLATDALAFTPAGGRTTNLDADLNYDIDYEAEYDRLNIPALELRLRKQPWVSLQGEMLGATHRERILKLTLAPARWDLGELDRVMRGIPGMAAYWPALAGIVNLGRIETEGPMERMNFRGRLDARDASIWGNYRFPELRADVSGALDMYRVLPFLNPPDGYDPERTLAFGLIHNLRAPDLYANFNGGIIKADASILPETGIKAIADIQRFPLEFFTGPYLSGLLSSELDFQSTETFETLRLKGIARLDRARYVIDRSRSAPQNARTDLNGLIHITDEAVLLDFENIDLTVRDTAGELMVRVLGDLGMRFDEGSFYAIDARKVSVDYPRLRPSLPGYLQYQLGPYRRYLSKGLEVTSKLDLSFYDVYSIKGDALLTVPFLNIDDLKARMDLAFGSTFMAFRALNITALRNALRAEVKGELRENAAGIMRPNLTAFVDLSRDRNTRIHPNLSMSGKFRMDVNSKPHGTRGKLEAKNFNLNYHGERLIAGGQKYGLQIEGVQLELPFQHDIGTEPRRLNERAGELFVRTYGFHNTPNLSVSKVAATHNPRGEYRPDRYYFLGGPGQAGVKARIIYEKNVMYIPWLAGVILHGKSGERGGSAGLISGRNMYFNLADLFLKNMEYGADIQIQDLDLEPYLPYSRGNYNGRISADLRLRGRNLYDPLRTMNARLSVHKLSPEFSGFATRLVMPERLMAGIVNNTLSIPSIRVELREGLIYSSVTMERGGLGGRLIRPAREELKQERVPLAQFTARSRRVVNEFGEESVTVQ